jgi:hypothetical protein
MANPFAKSRKIDNPHAIYAAGDIEWRILKTYKTVKSEDKDPYARWFVAARSGATFGGFDMGDTYKVEVIRYGRLVAATPEWLKTYRPGWDAHLPTPTDYIAQQENV